MPHPDDFSPMPEPDADLRYRAEARLAIQANPGIDAFLSETAERLVHELRMHQIELELQNEELRRTQEALVWSRSRYFDLYDLAPVGYLTLNEAGLIEEGNLAAARLLDTSRGVLANQSLTRFILPEDQDLYYHFRQRLLSGGGGRTTVLRTAPAARRRAAGLGSPGGQPRTRGGERPASLPRRPDRHRCPQTQRAGVAREPVAAASGGGHR